MILEIADEKIDWTIWTAIVVRTREWKHNCLVGDYRGCVVAVIPYQSEEGKANALSIARQIISASPDCTFSETAIDE